jgi:hypothetical protein
MNRSERLPALEMLPQCRPIARAAMPQAHRPIA